MRRLLLLFALAALVVPATAAAVLTPGRTVTNVADISALSVTSHSVVFAVRDSRADCGHVRLWDTATRGLWTLGSGTLRGCEEGPSGGFGIAQVATTGRRAFWVTHIGGNFTDYSLWTATPTRTTPRRLAESSSDSDGRRSLVLGTGTQEGVPYAVGSTVTYVADNGARLFRTTLSSPVRLLTAGVGPGPTRVAAALADGTVVLLSKTGATIRTEEHEPESVKAISLALAGLLVQIGSTVTTGGGTEVGLPPGALMLDHRQGTIVYRRGTQVRGRTISTGADTLLQTFAVKPYEPVLFSTDAWGTGWAKGSAVSWRSGPLR